MSVLSWPLDTREDGQMAIGAALLAQKLGLYIEGLKAEMQRGCVCSLGERGVAEDARSRRLTYH